MKKALVLSLLVFPFNVFAHLPEDSYLYLREEGAGMTLIWDIAAGNINEIMPIDTDESETFEKEELLSRADEILEIASKNISFRQADSDCEMVASPLGLSNYTSGVHASVKYNIACAEPGEVTIRYTLMHGVESGHRGILLYNWVEGNSARFEFIEGRSNFTFTPNLSAANNSAGTVSAGEGASSTTSWWQTLKTYFKEGIWHIWAGIDHVLFIITLLLPAVLIWQKRAWQGVSGFRPALIETIKIVTAFTIAHSITLTIATLGWVSIPARFTESVIAFSVLLVALNNIRPFVPTGRWSIAFAFGLLHGFGFAYVLSDLGLYSGGLIASLAGFNLGVEFGQLVIVLLLLPVIYYLRNTVAYRKWIMPGVSLLIALIALIWMVERIFNKEWLGF